ncbi:MAG: hypothetical protein KatS3mg061_0591 [Dehalococcoidia bacterium]|nr:MAG: hypothetical protein KatS3mg061_0591 [Dehalococcoidia bacterium]
MTCPSCGRETSEAGRFCYHCGAALAAELTTTPPEPPRERTVVMPTPVGAPPPEQPPAAEAPTVLVAGSLPVTEASQAATSASAPPSAVPSTPRRATLAVVSLVAGILAFLTVCNALLFFLPSLVAVIAGLAALRQIDRSTGALGGRGLAVAGIGLGLLGALTTCGLGAFLTLALSPDFLRALGGP